jgi:hypothetical protein
MIIEQEKTSHESEILQFQQLENFIRNQTEIKNVVMARSNSSIG